MGQVYTGNELNNDEYRLYLLESLNKEGEE